MGALAMGAVLILTFIGFIVFIEVLFALYFIIKTLFSIGDSDDE